MEDPRSAADRVAARRQDRRRQARSPKRLAALGAAAVATVAGAAVLVGIGQDRLVTAEPQSQPDPQLLVADTSSGAGSSSGLILPATPSSPDLTLPSSRSTSRSGSSSSSGLYGSSSSSRTSTDRLPSAVPSRPSSGRATSRSAAT